MKLFKLISLSLLAITAFGIHTASALSEDDKTMTSSDGAPRFSDPDDKTPGAINLSGSQASSGGVDPSSVRYDYDPTSGSYVPHKN